MKISNLEVVALADDPEVVSFAQRSLAGSSKFAADSANEVINCEYRVMINGIPLYHGTADECSKIQSWVDAARTARSMALFGRLVPYQM